MSNKLAERVKELERQVRELQARPSIIINTPPAQVTVIGAPQLPSFQPYMQPIQPYCREVPLTTSVGMVGHAPTVSVSAHSH